MYVSYVPFVHTSQFAMLHAALLNGVKALATCVGVALISVFVAGSGSSHALGTWHRTGIPTETFCWVSPRLRFSFDQVLLCFWMQALSPAMEQWRKRISKIAASFEANKAEVSTAEKQSKSANKSLKPEVTGPQLCVLTGRTLQSGPTTVNKAMHVFSESAWAAHYNTWHLIKLTPKNVIFSFLFVSFLFL